jgi:hypothetical protein
LAFEKGNFKEVNSGCKNGSETLWRFSIENQGIFLDPGQFLS